VQGGKAPLLEADPAPVLPQEGGAGDVLLGAVHTRDGRLLKYDAHRLASCAALLRVGGTAFAQRSLWFAALAYAALAICAFIAFRFAAHRLELVDTARAGEFVQGSAMFVGLLLTIHLSAAVQRWCSMRREVIGGLWSAVNDLALILAVHMPEPANRPLKTLALRYGLASMELLGREASIGDALLDPLRQRGLLSTNECALLAPSPAKAQICWVWVACAFRRLAGRELLSSRLLPQLYEICARGRGACDRADFYGRSQLPFAYVHLLSLLVHGTCAMVALKCGVVAAVAVSHALRSEAIAPVSDMESASVLVQQCALAFGVPLVYGAILAQAAALADPLSAASSEELPRAAYRIFMRDECEAFHTAGENPPKAIAKAAEQATQCGGAGNWLHDLAVAV